MRPTQPIQLLQTPWPFLPFNTHHRLFTTIRNTIIRHRNSRIISIIKFINQLTNKHPCCNSIKLRLNTHPRHIVTMSLIFCHVCHLILAVCILVILRTLLFSPCLFLFPPVPPPISLRLLPLVPAP